MSKGVIFSNIFNKLSSFSGALCSLLILALLGITFLNNQLNVDIPAANKVRDAFDVSIPFNEVAKLDLREMKEEIASNYVSSVPVSGYRAPAVSQPAAATTTNTFHIGEPTPVYDTAVDAGNGVMRYMTYGGRFLYAHSTRAFDPIKYLGIGSTFTATIDGVTSTYRVSARYVYNKALELDGSANNQRRINIYTARDNGVRHSLSLMTCGNGSNNDGNFRLVLYADAI
ncbi:hypothetical protein IKG31_01050 [Candidatus Saccharibacteria bacterium]|nr:hypothetical protein [Candidatus Saccharibacteria bacterium]